MTYYLAGGLIFLALTYLALILAVIYKCAAEQRMAQEGEKRNRMDALRSYNALVRETAFDAVAFATEQAGKEKKRSGVMSGESKLFCAVEQMMRILPDISEEDAEFAVESILGKIPKEGASGGVYIAGAKG